MLSCASCRSPSENGWKPSTPRHHSFQAYNHQYKKGARAERRASADTSKSSTPSTTTNRSCVMEVINECDSAIAQSGAERRPVGATSRAAGSRCSSAEYLAVPHHQTTSVFHSQSISEHSLQTVRHVVRNTRLLHESSIATAQPKQDERPAKD